MERIELWILKASDLEKFRIFSNPRKVYQAEKKL